MTNRKTIAAQKASGTKGRFGTLSARTPDPESRIAQIEKTGLPPMNDLLDGLALQLWEQDGIREIFVFDDGEAIVMTETSGHHHLRPGDPNLYNAAGEFTGEQISQQFFDLLEDFDKMGSRQELLQGLTDRLLHSWNPPRGSVEQIADDWSLKPGHHITSSFGNASREDARNEMHNLITKMQEYGDLPRQAEIVVERGDTGNDTVFTIKSSAPIYTVDGPEGKAERDHSRFVQDLDGSVSVKDYKKGEPVDARNALRPNMIRTHRLLNRIHSACLSLNEQNGPEPYIRTEYVGDGKRATYNNPEWSASEAEWAEHDANIQKFRNQ